MPYQFILREQLLSYKRLMARVGHAKFGMQLVRQISTSQAARHLRDMSMCIYVSRHFLRILGMGIMISGHYMGQVRYYTYT